MQTLSASATAGTSPSATLLELFAKGLGLEGLKLSRSPTGRWFYDRAWTPLITLWDLIWQRLWPHHTQAAVVADAQRGGAERLCSPGNALSVRLRSCATTAFSKARQRLPLEWVVEGFQAMAQALAQLSGPKLPAALAGGIELALGQSDDGAGAVGGEIGRFGVQGVLCRADGLQPVRGLMGVAARTAGGAVGPLSVATVRTLLCGVVGVWWLSWVPAAQRWEGLARACADAARARLPRRRRTRPAEPRAQYPVRRVFPALQGTRAQARQQLNKRASKS